MFDSDRWPPEWTGYAIVFLTLLAPVLGGSTSGWAQASLALLTGIFFVVAPPRRSLGRWLNFLFLTIALLPIIGFLPAFLFPAPAWRIAINNLGVQFPSTWSPQPWLTLESACLLWFGLAWTYYLFAYEWKPSLREKVWDVFCIGILGLAATLAICYAINLHVPFWPNVKEFGFFPNRNQTSNVLGLGGIFLYANAFRHLQHGRRRGWLWLAGLALVCWALILNFSRGGIILFFAGTFVWHIWWLITARAGNQKLIAWGPLAILAALLLLAGGTTWLRFRHESIDLLSLSQNGRVSIQRDAIDLFKASPLLGTGLGNFRSLFTAARHFYTSSSEAIHPESDWLWFAVEAGFAGPLLFLVGLIAWFRRSIPFPAGTWRGMRVAGLLCGIGFVVHGLFDVSGHRLGSLWPALFLASVALNPQIRNETSATIAKLYRVLGPFVSALGMWWLASVFGANVGPTSSRLAQLSAEVDQASVAGDYNRILSLATEGLAFAPLDWSLHYQRGLAQAFLYRSRPDVLRDFAVARYLLPNWPDLYIKEGTVWLTVNEPDLAFDIWEQGMRRWPDNACELYSDIYGIVMNVPDLRDRWRQLGHTDRRCLTILLRSSDATEFELELERLLEEDPDLRGLTNDELSVLFTAWYQKGDKLRLVEALRAHPEWEKIAWPQLARAFADLRDFRQAYETVSRFSTPPPSLPEIDASQIPLLAARFQVNHDVGHDGFQLAAAQFKSGAYDDALQTIQIALTDPRAPRALQFIAAQIQATRKNWPKAWEAMAKYEHLID
jgi:tetratricopeptide (TPR) repeat protein/O-antigen ligase